MLRLHKKTGINHLLMSVQWSGRPRRKVLDQLQMLAEAAFPQVCQG